MSHHPQFPLLGTSSRRKLKEALSVDTGVANHFGFSLLHTLPWTLTKNEVIEYEVEIGDALYICSFPKKGFGIVILYAKTITN